MSKQKLIDKYTAEIAKLRPYCPNRNSITEQLKNDIYKEFIDDLKQLDEPQKSVVPKFVAEWFEKNKEVLDLAIFIAIRELDDEEWPHKTDFENWLDIAENKPIETLIRMKNGYEVKKEPLYEVVFLEDESDRYLLMELGEKCYEIAPESENDGYRRQYFTESEIKEINEDFWRFREPVEEVAEG